MAWKDFSVYCRFWDLKYLWQYYDISPDLMLYQITGVI